MRTVLARPDLSHPQAVASRLPGEPTRLPNAERFPEAWMNDGRQVPQGVDPSRPSPAQMYDCYLGGTAKFPVDRDAVAGSSS